MRRAAKYRTGFSTFLGEAPNAVRQFQKAVRDGLAEPRDPAAVESVLFPMLLANEHFAELTFTYAGRAGFDDEGHILLDDSPRGQVSVMRSVTSSGEERVLVSRVHREGARFIAEKRERARPNGEQQLRRNHSKSRIRLST
jgi:hypothetical protein